MLNFLLGYYYPSYHWDFGYSVQADLIDYFDFVHPDYFEFGFAHYFDFVSPDYFEFVLRDFVLRFENLNKFMLLQSIYIS